MATQPQQRHRFVFGPFEVDSYTGQLSKHGIRIRLPGQPFQILLALLTHPGQLVTRQQLRNQIWGDGTNVDFEHSLNVAVNRLRRALSDSADQPRYIETVPGRGYRFIGALDEVPKIEAVLPVELPVAVEDGQQPTRRKAWLFIGATVLAITLTIAATLILRGSKKPSFAAKGTLVLSSFRNTTGDPVFDETLQQGLVVQLQESPFLSLVSENRIRLTLRLMGLPTGQVLTSDLAREVCERTGSSAVLEGSIARLGSRYVVGLNARSCNGETLYVAQVQAAQKENVLDALSEIVRNFRQGVGESLAVIRQHHTPLAEATTPSLDALKAYSMARKVAFSASFNSAVPLLQHAIELDPGFVMAHAFLGRIYADIGESVKSAQSTRRAYELRDRASERERFFITFSYDRQITGNLDSALRTAELWAQTFPRDSEAHALVSGFTSQGLGQYQKTIAEAAQALELDPDMLPAYLNLASGYLFLNRFDEAEAALRRAANRQLEIPDSQILLFYLAFLKNDDDGMNRAKVRIQGMPDGEDWMLQSQALVAAHAGRLRRAKALSQEAVESAQRSGHTERAAIYRAGSAAWESLVGNVSEARRNAAAAIKLSDARDVEYGAAFALSLTHDDARAEALANDLNKRFPQDTLVRFTYLPALNALASLHRRRPAEGLSVLQTNLPFDFADPGTNFFGFFGGLYPAYLRGQCLLSLGKPDEAALEFQKIVDHPGIVFADPIGALAHLEIGRASALSQDRVRAKAAYQKFFTLWRDADPDIPVFKQAKAEWARLN